MSVSSIGDKESQVLLTLMWFVAKFIVERNANFELMKIKM